MLGAIEGLGVLLLLSAFFAYMLAPIVAAIQRRVRFGRRRPLSRAAALILIYLVVFVPGAFAWRRLQPDIAHWVTVTAPRSVDHLFGGRQTQPFARIVARLP